MSSVSFEAPCSVIHAATQSNIMLLAQGAEMIDRLGQDWYATKAPSCFNSSAGGHFRHAIEHYRAVLGALQSGEINYEARARDELIESEANHARDVIDELLEGLEKIVDDQTQDRPLKIASETVEGLMLGTTLARELEFLISHTVHHFALIAVIAGVHGVQAPVNFGLAPSTLKHQQPLASSCAR
ncbi:MAG: hypothetical protein HOH58_11395 [Opitutaceae bacterium]|jgi:uncharacterized damage-inducible protein DinB|nr:hypothetical protein [Opitutaceae bacterium]